jgi:hypothetical protein
LAGDQPSHASPACRTLHPDLRLALAIALGLSAFGMLIGWLGLGPTPLGEIRRHLASPSLPLAIGPFAVFFATLFFCAIDQRTAVTAVLAAGAWCSACGSAARALSRWVGWRGAATR